MVQKLNRRFTFNAFAMTSFAAVFLFLCLSLCASAQQAPAPVKSKADSASSIAYLSATEQIKRFKAGTLSPVDVLTAQIERIRRYNGPLNTTGDEPSDFMKFNGKINAVTYEHFDSAIKAAQEAEKRYKAGTARPLEGITVAIKDENDVEGWRVTMGSLLLKDAPPCSENAPIIDKLLDAGAILHMQTTVPELYLHGQTWSRLWGVTRNPWNLDYAVGGSSGGSGAALAAGFTTLATGSDMGGSIRIPSAFCGLYGFKPPFGRVPTSDISFETLGPMARTFEDMALMQNIITGPSDRVLSSIRPKLTYPQQYANLKGVKIAIDYFGDWVEGGIDDSVRRSLDEAAAVLRRQGAIVTEVKLGWKSADIYNTFFNGLLSTAMGDMLLQVAGHEEQMTTYGKHFLKTMDNMGPAAMAQSDDLAAKLHRQLQEEVFEQGYQALIMPTLATVRVTAENDPTTDVVLVNGKPVKGLQFGMTYVWNLLSRYPVVNVPIGLDGANVPIGMQVIGNTFDDLAAFQVAYEYSTAGVQLFKEDLFPENE